MLEQKKLNCWEYKGCGREPGGRNVADLGVCPVPNERKTDGVHCGLNAGRCCWIVAGSLCNGAVQGTFAKKFDSCQHCDFYRMVKAEEQPNFQVTSMLLRKMKR